MKKLLLSACLLAGLTAAAQTTYTLSVVDATDIEGTLIEERPAGTNSDTDNGEAKHYQPLLSATIDGFTFSFTKGNASTDPALYYPFGTSKLTQFRLYKQATGKDGGNTMTITAPEGIKFGKITFAGSSGTKNAPVNASVGAVSGVTASAMVWQNDETVNSVTLTFTTGAFRITSMTVETEAGEIVEPTTYTFTKASTVETGQYLFVIDGKIACPVAASSAYGYMFLDVTATFDGDNIVTTDLDNAMNITVADDKMTLLDPANRYYGVKEGFYSSFQTYTEINEFCYWTYEFVDGAIKMTNAEATDAFVCKSGTYNNIAPTNKNPETYILPTLYKLGSQSAVETIEAEVDADAPVVYYNLQGQRVANPENGLYIRVQGNKVDKVIVK